MEMTPSDRSRLAFLRQHYGKKLAEEQDCPDPMKVMGWVPSESEAVFLLRIIDGLTEKEK